MGGKREKMEGVWGRVYTCVAGIQSPQPHLRMPRLRTHYPTPNVLRHLIDVKHREWSKEDL